MKVSKFFSLLFMVFMVADICYTAYAATKEFNSNNTLIPAGENGKSLTFIAIGDWGRRGGDNQLPVAKQMGIYAEKLNSSFTIALGDNFYTTGVATVTDTHWKESFEDVYTAPSLQKRWYVVLGNHDYGKSPDAQIEYTKLSKRWYLPARYYSETLKVDDTTNVLLLVYDSDPLIQEYYKTDWENMAKEVARVDTAAMLRWMDSTLANSDAQWKIVCAHHPVYSSGSGHGDTPEVIEKVLPMLKKYHVQAYLCGHDHDMEHIHKDGEITDYFVSGAAASTRQISKQAGTKFASIATGFLAATISAQQMDVNFIDDNGKVLYETTVGK